MIIQSKNVWINECFRPCQIEIENNRIKALYSYNEKSVDYDYGERKILPGLIEIHSHGMKGQDASHATHKWVREWMKVLPYEGVTSITPAISTAPEADILKSLSIFDEVIKEGYAGSKIIGIYSEGPFVSEKFKGAQDSKYRIIPDKIVLDKYQKASGNRMKYIMVAPEELDEDMTFIKQCVSQGIRVTLGHTGATFDICEKAREAGAVCFTHTYNGMLGLNHREPGTVGAVLYFDDMYAELIGDGVHVSKVAATILARLKGKDRLISITDSNRCKGLSLGKVNLFGRNIIVCEDGVARLEDGTIAGSASCLNQILKNEIENFGFEEDLAINSVTCNPARMLGIDDEVGYIKPNYRADLAILNSDYSVCQTYVDGVAMIEES